MCSFHRGSLTSWPSTVSLPISSCLTKSAQDKPTVAACISSPIQSDYEALPQFHLHLLQRTGEPKRRLVSLADWRRRVHTNIERALPPPQCRPLTLPDELAV